MKTTTMRSLMLLLVGASSAALAEESGNQLAIAPPNVVEEIVVLGQFIPDEKRETSEISNVLDEETLSILSDSNVGDALTRVTGLSLVGGKYVYVRGLGERYSSSLLNAARISSPVPFQKTVPLDIVPNSIVRSLLVQKTYSSEYPGDFSGGLVDIRTKATPDDNYLTVSVSGSGNSETTFGDGLTYTGGAHDRLGYDDGTRDLPENIQALSSEQFESFEFPEKAGLGASFYNFWDIKERELEPNVSGDVEAGLRFDFDNGMALGILAAGKYSHNYFIRDKDFRRYEFTGVNGGSNQTVQYRQYTTQETINASGFINLGLEIDPNNTVSFTHVILRQTEDVLQEQSGISSEDDVNTGTAVRNFRLQWTDNEIISNQLSGEHYFTFLNDASLNWRIVDGGGTRESPDRRTYTYAENNDGLLEVVTSADQAAGDLREAFQAPDRNYARLEDDIEEYGADLELPFILFDTDLLVKAGWASYERSRESNDRLFRFDLTTSAPDYVGLQFPGQLFSLENWGNNYITVTDFSATAANASGIFPFAESGEETDAYYAAIDWQVHPRVRLQGGARREETKLNADAFGGNTLAGTDNAVSQTYTNTFASGSITYEFINDMQIRLAASETINLPSLLEITGSRIRNPENFQLYQGNVFLQPATIENVDARWEWYFGDADSMSLGVFRKEFDNPIEVGEIQAQGNIFTWFNAEEATLEGVEYEFTKDLYLGSWFGLNEAWDYFTLSANVTYVDSEVTLLGAGETAADVPITGGRQLRELFANERPLTGQSDWLGNAMLSYRNYDSGIESSLAYNYTGERIVLVGSRNAPDIIEDSRGRLDFLFKYLFYVQDSEVELELKLRNILNEEIRWTQGGQIYEVYDDGVTYSLGVTVTF